MALKLLINNDNKGISYNSNGDQNANNREMRYSIMSEEGANIGNINVQTNIGFNSVSGNEEEIKFLVEQIDKLFDDYNNKLKSLTDESI